MIGMITIKTKKLLMQLKICHLINKQAKNKMKRVFSTLIALLSILDCNAQKQENEMKDYWKKIESTVNEKADKNLYVLAIASNGCNFEILINNALHTRHFEESGLTGLIPINPFILKSGKQTITVKIYPVRRHEEKGIKFASPLSLTLKYKSDPSR